MVAEREIDIVVSLKDQITAGLEKIYGELDEMKKRAKETTKGVSLLSKGFSAFKSVLGGVVGSIKFVVRQLFSLKAMIAGVGIGLLVKSFIDAASAAEQYRTRLTILLGSVEEGTRLFKEMSDFAARVPKTYEEIMASATALAGVMKGGVDEITKWMPMIVDLSAVTGLTLEETTSQIIRMYSAGAASADLFRERGVLAMLGFQAGVSYSAEVTRKRLMDAFEDPASKFRGASVLLANTWEGLMSMMGDAWFQFRNMVMDSGLFDFLKAGLGTILDEINKLKEEGTLQRWAQSISNAAVSSITWVLTALGDIYDFFHKLIGYLMSAFVGLKRTVQDAIDTIVFWQSTTAEEAKRYVELKDSIEEYRAVIERTKKSLEEFNTPETQMKLLQYETALQKAEEELRGLRSETIKTAAADEEAAREMEKLAEEYKNSSKGAEWAKGAIEDVTRSMDAQRESVKKFTDAQAEARRTQYYLLPKGPTIVDTAKAKAELTEFKAFGDAREAMLKQWAEDGLISVEEYHRERVAITEWQSQAEIDVQKTTLETLGKAEVDKRIQVQAKISALKDKQVKELLKVDEDATKMREKVLNEQFKREKITVEQYNDERVQIAEEAARRQTDRLMSFVEISQQRVADVEEERNERRLELRKWYDERVTSAAQEGDIAELTRIEKNFYDQYALIDQHTDKIMSVEMAKQDELYTRMAQIRERGEEEIQRIVREGGELVTKIRQKQMNEELKVQKTYLDALRTIGDIGTAAAVSEDVIRQEWDLRIAAAEEYYNRRIALAESTAEKIALIEQKSTVQNAMEGAKQLETSLAFQKELAGAFQEWGSNVVAPVGDMFGDLATVMEAFYEKSGSSSKKWANMIKAMQIAQGTMSAIQASLSAFNAGVKFGETIGNAPVGLAMGISFATAAFAAGMAKVAMMKSVQFAEGGMVPGMALSPTSDNVSARLTSGEYVQPVSAVRYYGADAMEALRRQLVPRDAFAGYGVHPRMGQRMFAAGGMVPRARDGAAAEGARETTIVNLEDRADLDRYLASRPGERVLLNFMSRNRSMVRKILE